MPGAGLVVVKAELVLGGFETVFDGPAVALHCHQLFHGCANRTPCGEESEIAVGDVAADQQPRVQMPGNAASKSSASRSANSR